MSSKIPRSDQFAFKLDCKMWFLIILLIELQDVYSTLNFSRCLMHLNNVNCIIENGVITGDDQFADNELIKSIRQLEFRNSSIYGLSHNLFENFEKLSQINFQNSFVRNISFENVTFKSDFYLVIFKNTKGFQEIGSNFLKNQVTLKKIFFDNHVLTAVDTNAFAQQTNLVLLEFIKNELTFLPAGLLDNLGSLKAFTCNDNKIQSIPKNFFINNCNLRAVYLSSNFLTSFEGNFGNMRQLVLFDVSFNNLTESVHGNIEKIDTKSNALESLFVSEFINELKAKNNLIRNLTCASNMRIMWLDLSHNLMQELGCIVNMQTLIVLNLSDNQLEYLEKESLLRLQKLRWIDVRCNKFKKNSFDSVSQLVSLKTAYSDTWCWQVRNHLGKPYIFPLVNEKICGD